jgi:hypothetical protein
MLARYCEHGRHRSVPRWGFLPTHRGHFGTTAPREPYRRPGSAAEERLRGVRIQSMRARIMGATRIHQGNKRCMTTSYQVRKLCSKPDGRGLQGVFAPEVQQAATGLSGWGRLEQLERVMGIEPTLFAWEARVLPLNDTRAARIIPEQPRAAAWLLTGPHLWISPMQRYLIST